MRKRERFIQIYIYMYIFGINAIRLCIVCRLAFLYVSIHFYIFLYISKYLYIDFYIYIY